MNLETLTDSVVSDTAASLPLFLPELILGGTILVLLLVRVFPVLEKIPPLLLALVGTGLAFGSALAGTGGVAEPVAPQGLFSQLLVYDSFTLFFRCLLLGFALLFCLLTWISRLSDREDHTDFYALVLGATLGMLLMASANHLLMVFLAVEMASVPSYVLAGILKGRRHSSEAALKYAVYGAGAAGIMLYGISLIAGLLGTAHLPTIAARLVELDLPTMIATGTGEETLRVLALGGLMILVGLAFKLSAFPFHFWCPDVFEGASAEINAFLSVASKAAALALLVRVAVGFGFVGPVEPPPREVAQGVFNVADPAAAPQAETPLPAVAEEPPQSAVARLQPVRTFAVLLLALISAVTCTFGNLAAYGQSNVKRMLAYSTIAHAGYMMMPVAAALAVAGTNPVLARASISALTFYIALYLFMNLGAFAIVAFLRNAMQSEQMDDYAGLIARCPATVVCFSIILVSLIGLPPFAGFIGKFSIFAVLMEVGGPVMITLLVIAGLNTAVSVVYYLRLVKVMTIDPEPDSRGPVALPLAPTAYTLAVTLPVVVFGVWFDALYRFAESASRHLFS